MEHQVRRTPYPARHMRCSKRFLFAAETAAYALCKHVKLAQHKAQDVAELLLREEGGL
jgi:hypothetical protein